MAGAGRLYKRRQRLSAKVHQAIADAATEAVANLRPARMTLGSIKVQDPDGNMKRYVFDSRDPVVINNVLHTMQFLDVSTTPPQPITTLVNWSNHPEAAGSKNKLISSDFVHYLRQELEQKRRWASGLRFRIDWRSAGARTCGAARRDGDSGDGRG